MGYEPRLRASLVGGQQGTGWIKFRLFMDEFKATGSAARAGSSKGRGGHGRERRDGPRRRGRNDGGLFLCSVLVALLLSWRRVIASSGCVSACLGRWILLIREGVYRAADTIRGLG